jgi:ZIP family zinc transporter
MSIYLAPLVSFLSTMFGVIFLLVPIAKPKGAQSAMIIGSCAGIMLGASVFSLILPALQLDLGFAGLTSKQMAVLCILLGAVVMLIMHALIPHEHFLKGREGLTGDKTSQMNGIVLIVFAVMLHNIPEGFALGVGSQIQDLDAARALVLGIGLQNIPEGGIIAVSLISLGGSKKTAFLAVFVSALAEALAASLGVWMGHLHAFVTNSGLLLSAGAMIYVVSQEMIPESHGDGFEGVATIALVCGFCLSLFLGN